MPRNFGGLGGMAGWVVEYVTGQDNLMKVENDEDGVGAAADESI